MCRIVLFVSFDIDVAFEIIFTVSIKIFYHSSFVFEFVFVFVIGLRTTLAKWTL